MSHRILLTVAYTLLSLLAPSSAAPLITEFMASNDSALYDEDGDSSDWIEIHNPDASAVDLAGYSLSNDPGQLGQWQLPAVTLAPNGFLIVFASNKDRDIGELHANFRLAKDGGYLALVEPDGQTIASEFANYPEQFDDISYGLAQTGSTTTTTLVREDDNCTVIVPTSDIGTAWQDVGFDDASWRAATTGIGYERSSGYESLISDSGDVESETYNITSTVYVRIPFTVDSVDGITRLLFRMKYDDGFVAYLNGTEIASGNRPANPAWNSTASGDHSDNLAVNFVDTDVTAQQGLLNIGDNVLAIHGMNGGNTSSDLLVLPRLEADLTSDPGFGVAGYFQASSPGQVNGSDQGLPAGSVVYSIPGRGFTGSLSLTLSTASPAGQIRYTTNGNVPTASSTLYSSPIAISTSTLVLARVFESGLVAGPLGEEGYIRLSANADSFSSDLPVVIMERFTGGPTAANGKAYTFFAFFEPDPGTGRTVLDKPYSLGTRGGWKVRGSSSAGFAKKAYSIEAWNEFNRNKDVSPLGMPEESDFILNARSVFDPSLMRNAFIYELSNQVGRYAVRTQFVELFKDDNGGDLNFSNDYDGVYTFMEKISRDGARVDVERLPAGVTTEPGITGGYMLKVDRLDPGDGGISGGGQRLGWVYPKEEDATGAQSSYIGGYLNTMQAALSTADYEQYIDSASWIDHHLLNVLSLNADALRLSTYFFKARNRRVEFGPIWDFDRSMQSTDGRDDNPSTWAGGTNYFTFPWWNQLFQSEDFWQDYIDRYFELRDGTFSTANVHGIIDAMAAELDESQVRNFQRWGNNTRGGYTGEVNLLKSWLGTRLNWMDGQFAPRPSANRAAGVYPAGTTVTLSANLAGGRTIYYTLDGTDPRGPSAPPVPGTLLFDADQPVRALVPNSDIGTSWRGGSEPFDETGWLSGTNGVGYERGSGYAPYINIDVDAAMANRTSCYVRIPFEVDAGELATWNFMTLQMRYDDGFVAYLNGTQIAASNAPGGVQWSSSATQTNDDGAAVTWENFNANTFVGSLQAGTNILAIHALNESTGSSDFLNQARISVGFNEGGGTETGGIEYTGPITLTETARLFARVLDPSGGHATNSGQTPVGTGWSAPIQLEYLVDEVPADATNLAISEIMFDPYDLGDALTGDGEFEWVELQNISGGRISLTGCAFTGGIDFVFPARSLGAGERILVVKNQAAFEQVYGSGRNSLIAGMYSGSLNNGGETLEIRDASGAMIQSAVYDSSVAKKGFSALADLGGWTASRSLLGSPGLAEPSELEVPSILVNEVVTNPILPELDGIELHNPSASPVDVGGWFLSDDLGEPEKFRIPDETSIGAGGYLVFSETDFNPTPGVGTSFALSSAGEEVYLIAATPVGGRLDYVDGFEFGDASANVSFGRHVTSVGEIHYPPMAAMTFGAANSAPRVGPLVISELQYNPAPGESEFIEIQNVSGAAVPLAGVEVGGTGYLFAAGTPDLAPGEVVLLVEIDPATFRASYSPPAGVGVYGPYAGSLDNGGETIELRVPEAAQAPADPDLMVAVETVAFSDSEPWPPAADGRGFSLQRRVPVEYGSDPASWEVSAEIGGTPGVIGETPPDDWRALYFTAAEIADPNISGPSADIDLDGIGNLLEHVLGTDPRDANSRLLLEASVVIEGGDDFLLLRHRQRIGVTDFQVAYQMSDDLGTWGDAGAFLQVIETVDQGDGTSIVTLRSVGELGAPGGVARFLRLSVSSL